MYIILISNILLATQNNRTPKSIKERINKLKEELNEDNRVTDNKKHNLENIQVLFDFTLILYI